MATVWFWRDGRCPEIGHAVGRSLVSGKDESEPRAGDPRPAGRDGATEEEARRIAAPAMEWAAEPRSGSANVARV